MKSGFIKNVWLFIIFVLVGFVASTPASGKKYTITDLGTLGGKELSAQAMAINNLRQVVGWSYVSREPDVVHAFLWENGKMRDLGTIGESASYALGINNLGQVAGYTSLGNFSCALWESININILGSGIAYGINDNKQVVGDTNDFGGTRGFIWENGIMTNLSTLGGPSSSLEV